MVLQHILSEKNIVLNLESTEKDELFEEMIQRLVELYPDIDRKEALDSLLKREDVMTTGILPALAVPHGIMKSQKNTYALVGYSKGGIDYDSLDGKCVHWVFMFLFSADDTGTHLGALKELALLLQDSDFVNSLSDVKTPESFISLLKNTDF